jgi:hypothetical protein
MSDLLDRYPVLSRLPETMRAGYAAKGDAGLALTEDECAALGLSRCESFVLQPSRWQRCPPLSARCPKQAGGTMSGARRCLGSAFRARSCRNSYAPGSLLSSSQTISLMVHAHR